MNFSTNLVHITVIGTGTAAATALLADPSRPPTSVGA
jgi:hypothetical protein